MIGETTDILQQTDRQTDRETNRHARRFLCGWSVGVELDAGLPERPGSQQRRFLQASQDVSVCSVLIYVQRIGFTTMRYINIYILLTYLLT